MLEVAVSNLLSPMILFFLLGIIAVLVNSDLKVPSAFYTGYTMIILLTIGIKGGAEMRHVPVREMLPAAVTVLLLSFAMLFLAFLVIFKLYKYSLADSAAVAAHYGSVSAVTFIAGMTFLEKMGATAEPYVTALLVLMEGPAIIGAIVWYKWRTKQSEGGIGHVLKEAFFGKSIFLLLGGIFIGLVANQEGLLKIKPLFGDLFYGILCIFLLHLGMVSTLRIREFKGLSFMKITFAFLLPLLGGLLGLAAGSAIGLTVGGVAIVATLTASASYIAAPAAIEQAIPEANSGLYIGSALGMTLPFNLIIGIPLYYVAAQWLVG